MCLDKVTETYDEPSTLIVDGWKEFVDVGKKLTVAFAIKGSNVIPLDQWIAASDEHAKQGVGSVRGGFYKPGFHAYADERELKGSLGGLRRVFLRKISCLGTQDGKKTAVAQEMYVPSDNNGWPPLGK